jgi:hypothetical protein
MNAQRNTLKHRLLIGLAALGLSSAPALADGFSASLEVPILPSFSVSGTLNYSFEVVPNLLVGATIGGAYNFNAQVGGVGGRVGVVYVAQLLDADNTFVNAYVGAGANVIYVIASASGLSFAADANAGVFARYGISRAVRIYGGVDGAVGFNFTGNQFIPVVSGYAGVRFEPITNLILYVQGAAGLNDIKVANFNGSSLITNLTAPGFVYDLRAGLFYSFIPEFQLGVYTGYNGGFSLGVSAKFTEKPGTLGTPGNYLP